MSRLLAWLPGAAQDRRTEPGAALFRGLHLRLTLYYSGVVLVALVASGLVLYFGLQDLSLGSVRTTLHEWSDFQTQEWLRAPPRICGGPGSGDAGRGGNFPGRPQPARPPAPLPVYGVCFDTSGNVLAVTQQAPGSDNTTPTAFLDASLVPQALRSASASDTVETGADAGPVLRMAAVVRDPNTGQALGVAQVGQSIALQLDTLRLLRALLLLLIALGTLGSFAGGLLLADRALQPARLAFARQQAFIGDASHQLRTPLTLLRADADVLLRHREQLPADDVELIEDIAAETGHMDRLATELLSLARLDAGSAHLEHDVVDLSELASDLARRVATLAEERRLHITQRLAANATLLGDHQAIEQAALILVDNAMKYTPPGGTVALQTETSNGHATLTVGDTGIGMPAEQIEHLGERFYRGDPSRSRETGGTGLGLAIAFRVATAHGGTLRFSSAPGAGTTATLSLPSSRAQS